VQKIGDARIMGGSPVFNNKIIPKRLYFGTNLSYYIREPGAQRKNSLIMTYEIAVDFFMDLCTI
jgi:hypothetical protein